MPDLNNVLNNNAVNTELEKQVDDLSKPGNEDALNKALTDDLKQSGDPANNDPIPADDPKDEDLEDKGDDPLKKDTDPDKDVKKSKADKVKEILAERNEARDKAAQAELDNQALSKQIADLNAKIDKLASGNKGDGDDLSKDQDPSADNKPLTRAELDKYFAEREAKANEAAVAEKSNVIEVEALDKGKFPHALEHKDTIAKAMDRFKMSADQAYAYLKGQEIIPTDNASSNSNANKLNTGDQPKNNLIRDRKPEDMTTAEQEAYLRKEQAAGRITL